MDDLELPRRYRLAADPILGEGGMGRVLRAQDVVLDQPVALKIVRPDLAADPRFRKLFDLEVRISARFAHPHIVPLHDLGELADGTPYLGLALADAGSFASLREDPDLAWDELIRLTLELLEALAHLHARDVLHRDLKPENVLLFTGDDGRKHVWLADLGLANAGATLAKRTGRMEGTPGFMAPEQKLGLPREYGPWTDLYSTGVILWEMITGELPFPLGMTAIDRPLPVLKPRAGMRVPEGLELVLANLLSPEPLSRYDLAADLTTELRVLADHPRSDRPRQIDEATLGTVAAAVPMPVVDDNSLTTLAAAAEEEDAPAQKAASTMFFDLDEIPRHDPMVPFWNRPRPSEPPALMTRAAHLGATARASLPLFAVRELPVVARKPVQQEIWDVALRVRQEGRPSVLLVIGEAGAGKTSVVESVLRTLEEGGWCETVKLGYQVPPGKEDGYAGAARSLIRPWKESRTSLVARLRRQLARIRGQNDPVVREEADMLARWSGLLEPEESPVAAGYGLREVYRSLEARAWRGLSCLFIDDAQWAVQEGDGLSIAENVLQASEESTESRPLLVVATLRSEDLSTDRGLAEQVARLVAAGALRIDVPRLDRAGTQELLAESLTLDPALAEKVAERCEGNPLFARQLLIDWSSRGWLVDTGSLRFGLAAGVNADTALPDDAEALFAERVATLAAASGHPRRFTDALHMAALGGQTLPLELLKLCAGAEIGEFMRGCGLWVEQQELVKFDHGLLFQAVRNQAMDRKDAVYLHRRLARMWGKYGRSALQDVSFEVGRHAHAGEDWSMATNHLLTAAATAFQRGRSQELDEAARLAVEACSREKRLATHLGRATLWLARAHEAKGEASDAAVLYARALGLMKSLGDPKGVIEAQLGVGWAARQAGDPKKAEESYSSAMTAARELKDTRLEARAIGGMAWLEQQKRNFEGADILFTRVLNRFNQLGDRRGMAEAALGQAYVARRSGHFDDAVELYEEAATTYREGEDLLGVANALMGEGNVLRQRKALDQAEERFRTAMEIAEDLGASHVLMDSQLGLAEIYRMRGELERARRVYLKHARWAERAGSLEAAILAHLGLALCAQAEGDLGGMYTHANNAVQALTKVPGHWLWATYRLVVATLLALRGDEEQTYRWLWSAAELGLADTVDLDSAHNLSVIADVAYEKSWVNVLKVAGKLGLRQWQFLDEPSRSERIRRQVRERAHSEVPLARR